MALEICPVAYTSESYDRAVIVDTVRERPLPLPLFEDANAADAFLDFVNELGLDFVDLGAFGPDTLERLHAAWLNHRAVDAEEARHA